tara:strand:- start:884 stop:1519 length:636 start_codon:yes stop_codon:yes gene_type:complete
MPRCLECKTKFEQYQFNNKFCKAIDCQVAKGLHLLDKGKKQQAKEVNRRKKNKLRDNPNIYSGELKAKLQSAINEIVRLIDKGCRCIDCDRMNANPCWDGGHRQSRGSHANIRYHLDNIFKQTRYCNSKSEGDKQAYNDGIKKMYGLDYYNYVDGLGLKYPKLQMPNSELPSKLDEANKIIKELKSLDLIYPPETRIKLREKYNKRIGIYE